MVLEHARHVQVLKDNHPWSRALWLGFRHKSRGSFVQGIFAYIGNTIMHLGETLFGFLPILRTFVFTTVPPRGSFQLVQFLSESFGIGKGTSIRYSRQCFDTQVNTERLTCCLGRFGLFLMHTDGNKPSACMLGESSTADLLIHWQVVMLFEP